jgi:hypothetical protein
MKAILGLFSLTSLLACLALPVMHFQGSMDNQTYKDYFLIASAAWFLFAIAWASQAKRSRAR